ncbi:MAG TPA: GDSL-type esterase/lipase family protein [Burkholderiaceae bacterium]
MNKRISTLAAAALAALNGIAAAQAPADLVLLPAPADAWRISAGTWESRVDLTGASAVTPPNLPGEPNARVGVSASGAAGRREALAFDWRDAWFASLRLESAVPLDLRPWLGGTLEFDLHVDALEQGGLGVKVACGNGCERRVPLLEPARAISGKGWQRLAVSMSCFQREGGDFSRVTLPFALEAGGSGRVSVSNVRLVATGKGSVACADYRTESVTPVPLVESWSLDWWMPRHEAKRKLARELVAAGHSPKLVFIGDSITEGWEKEGQSVWQRAYAPHDALDLGFGGDRTENVLWRLQHGELDGLAPKVTVLMIGTNNTGHRAEDPQTTAAGIRRIVQEIRQRLPGTQVLLLAIFPRGEKPDDELRRLNERVNGLIAPLADGRVVHYLNINAAFTRPDGTLSRDVQPDLLHLSEQGYAIWQREMQPTLAKLLGAATP